MPDDARRLDEQSTLRRSQILNLPYYDTSSQSLPIHKNLLTNEELYRYKVVPLENDSYNLHFGIINTTSQNTMQELRHRFANLS